MASLSTKIDDLDVKIAEYEKELGILKAKLETAEEVQPRNQKQIEKIEKIENDIRRKEDAIAVKETLLTRLYDQQARAQPVAGGGGGGGGTVQTSFMELWKHIMDGKVSFKNKFISLQNSTNNVKWIDEVQDMLVRESWEELRDSMLSGKKKYVMLKGKSGRGKSVFLIYLIYFILKRAMDNRDADAPKHVAEPVIIYVNRNGCAHWMSLDAVRELPKNMSYPQVDYFFSDNVDIMQGNLGSYLNLALTSDDVSVLKEFTKRMQEAGENAHTYCMMSLDIDEMKALYGGKLNEEQIQFRFDVVGGNPRRFIEAPQTVEESNPYYKLVHGAVELMFGQDYLPVGENNTWQKNLGDWAINLIVCALQRSDNSNSTDSSLFKDYIIKNVNKEPLEMYATTFMGIVASGIADYLKGDLNESLKRLFGSTGLGNAFEFSCHGLLLNSNSKKHWCWDENGAVIELSFGEKNKMLSSNIVDIKNLNDGEYGLPTVCNFPLVDAVIKPDIVLQMTISNHHEGAIGRADDIASAMGINLDKMKMVFVVPLNQIKSFIFPPGLVKKNVPMYLTSNEATTEDVLMQHKRPRRS